MVLTDVCLGRIPSRVNCPGAATDPVPESGHQGRGGRHRGGRVLGDQGGDLDVVRGAGHRPEQSRGPCRDGEALVGGVVLGEVLHTAVPLLPPDAHGVVLVGEMLAGGGSVHGGADPAEVVEVAGGPGEVLETAAGREEGTAALDLRDLHPPLPAGGGVGAADDGVHLVAGGAGVKIDVLAGEGPAEQRRVGPARTADSQRVVSTETHRPSSAGGWAQHRRLEVDPDLADVGVGGADVVGAGLGGGGGVLDEVGVVGAGAPATAHGEDAADSEGLSTGARGRPTCQLGSCHDVILTWRLQALTWHSSAVRQVPL